MTLVLRKYQEESEYLWDGSRKPRLEEQLLYLFPLVQQPCSQNWKLQQDQLLEHLQLRNARGRGFGSTGQPQSLCMPALEVPWSHFRSRVDLGVWDSG
jgi:hypothetical protein